MYNARIKQYWNDFISLAYPHNCSGCGIDLANINQLLCWSCINALPLTDFEKKENNLVENLFIGRIKIKKATSLLYFGKDSLTQQLIHQIKYKNNKSLGIELGKMMGQIMLSSHRYNDIDVIVPLPLNKKKETLRGYNQAAILSLGIGEILQKPVESVAIIRTKFTETQTKKSRVQRWKNVEEVFELNNTAALENKNVLLVDDVVTTGATLEACGHALLKANGIQLSFATLAFASKI